MTKFLVDQDVNQRVLKRIPITHKGFEVLYPESGSITGASDSFVAKKASAQGRVLVTYDKDFLREGLGLDQFPYGVLLIHPPRHAQRRVGEVLERFCRLVQREFPEDPYNFVGKIIEIYENRVEIKTDKGTETYRFQA